MRQPSGDSFGTVASVTCLRCFWRLYLVTHFLVCHGECLCVCVRRACVCVCRLRPTLLFFFLHKLPSVGQLTSPVYEVLLFVCGWKKTNYGAPTHEMWRKTTPDDIFLCLSCHANVAHPDLPSPIPTPPYRHESREKLCWSAKPRVRGRTLCRG